MISGQDVIRPPGFMANWLQAALAQRKCLLVLDDMTNIEVCVNGRCI